MDSIIFDVDGTLWDSTEVVAKAWNNYLQQEEHMNITFTADQSRSCKAVFSPFYRRTPGCEGSCRVSRREAYEAVGGTWIL